MALGDKANEDSWSRGLCKVVSTSNAELHLSKMHPNSVEVMSYLESKKKSAASTGALDSGSREFALGSWL